MLEAIILKIWYFKKPGFRIYTEKNLSQNFQGNRKIEKITNGLTVWYRKVIKELSWLSETIWAGKYFLNNKKIILV